MPDTCKYIIDLNIETIRLPPFQDILILGKNAHQGKIGLSRSLELLTPNEFELIEINDDSVEAVFICKRILKKIAATHVIQVLKEKVFSMVADGELIKVEFKLNITYNAIEIDI